MEKQAYLPIKFYPVNGWQEYERLKEYGGDKAIVKEYNNVAPGFQMVLPNIGRRWDSDSFQSGTFDLVNYDTGTTYDLNAASYPMTPLVYSSGNGFRTLVYRRFPTLATTFPAGRYYYHLAEVEGDSEWFSEIFELCDLKIDAFDEELNPGFQDDTGFATFTSTYQLAWRLSITDFYKTGVAALASAYMEFSAFLEEEFDLYVYTTDATGGAGTDWDEPVFFYLSTDDNVLISDICRVDTTDSMYHFKLKAESGGTIRLYMYIRAADATEGTMYVSLYRTYSDEHVQMRWSNDKNFCKIVYDQERTNIPFLYENIYFFNTKNNFTAQVIDENSVNENVIEDDEANKYRIIGTNQKWNAIQLFGSECLLNAMSLLRLHKYVEIIKENGEPIDVVETLLEQSVVDYHGALMKLRYREESCSTEECGFDPCYALVGYPTLLGAFDTAIVPAAADYSGEYCILYNLGTYQTYLSNGAAWGLSTTYRLAGRVLVCQNYMGDDFAQFSANGLNYRFFHTANTSTNWYPIVSISSVADATGGQATVNIAATYWFGAEVWCQVEYYTGSKWDIPLPYFDEDNWTPVIEKENLASQTGARALTATCGAGTYYFRVHIWDDECDLWYSNTIQQTIT